MSLIQSSYGTPNHLGNFEVVTLEGNNLVHYFRDNGPGKWSRGAVITTKATAPGSLIQSSYGTPGATGNFEVVVTEGKDLVHYWRNNSPGKGNWIRQAVITSNATGPAALIQSTYGTPGALGNFEVIVHEGKHLVHYWRNNSPEGNQQWNRGAVIA